MCTEQEKLTFDSYVEGNFVTKDLIRFIEEQSEILDYEIYRGILLPNNILKIGNDINQNYDKEVMSFSKNISIAQRFSDKHVNDDSSLFSKVIIRLKKQKALDLYKYYDNLIYKKESEILVITKPLYINSISYVNDLVIVDC